VERESLDKLIVSAIRTHSENKSLSLEYDPFAYQDLLMWGWVPCTLLETDFEPDLRSWF
jgi:hypothetical protein